MASTRTACALVLGSLMALSASAFYLPGIAPVNFEEGAAVDVLVNKLTSVVNHIPLDYYHLAFCRPDGFEDRKVRSSKHLNIGQILVGEHALPSPYEFIMNVNETCKLLCKKKLKEVEVKQFNRLVRDKYFVRLMVDNLPVVVKVAMSAESVGTQQEAEEVRVLGYPLGYATDSKEAKAYINNHLSFRVLIHRPTTYSAGNFDQNPQNSNVYRVVGVEVTPSSISQQMSGDNIKKCEGGPVALNPKGPGQDVVFSYDVEFQESQLEWATRWDPLLDVPDEYRSIQWFSIINSVLISLFLAVVVAVILLRTVYLDFARYNALDGVEDLDEDTGWKLVHGDVFRTPPFAAFLCVLCGSGIQILIVSVLTCAFAMTGFLSPANRGGLLSAMIGLWVFSNSSCGFFAARLYSGLGGTNKRLVTLGSASFLSGIMFAVFFVVNLVLFVIRSGAAVPFFRFLFLVIIWLGVSVPLNILGAMLGYRGKAYAYPCHTNHIPREVPESNSFLNIGITLLAGAQPFTVVFMQLIFVLNSLWQNSFFYMFGFLFITFVLLILSSVEVGIVVTYVTLNREDYRWWWRSFLTTASAGVYVLLYALHYAAKASGPQGVHLASTILFSGYVLLFSMCFALACGTLGFYSSLWFALKMYSSIRVD